LSIANAGQGGYSFGMLGIIFLIAIGVAFYAFVGLGPEEAVKVMLVLMWGLLALSIPAGLLYEIMK